MTPERMDLEQAKQYIYRLERMLARVRDQRDGLERDIAEIEATAQAHAEQAEDLDRDNAEMERTIARLEKRCAGLQDSRNHWKKRARELERDRQAARRFLALIAG